MDEKALLRDLRIQSRISAGMFWVGMILLVVVITFVLSLILTNTYKPT